MSGFSLRVFHPTIDPRTITEELGLPPVDFGMDAEGTRWRTALFGSETGGGDVNDALRDIAARFEAYRFLIDEIRAGGGRVEIAVTESGIAPEVSAQIEELGISLVPGVIAP